MAVAGVIIETPALEAVGLPIQGTEYDIEREINAAGAWSVSFPASQILAKQVRSRWRISIVEEGRTDYLLYRGIVTQRNYRVERDGTGVLTLQGYSRLYGLTASTTHNGLAYDGSQTIEDIANDLTGETVTVPASASGITPTVKFSETSKLAALLSACELARYNLRETFDHDGFELVEQDDVPDSGFRFVNVQQAGPELENAADNGMGLIAGTPTIGYDGKDLATRIIPLGVEWDGKVLTLGSSDKTTPYTILSALNPDGTTYYYLEDAAAVAASGVIELQYVRADVKNPSDDAGTRLAAANVLYQLAAGELHKRRFDVLSFATEIANGRHIDALPGDRVRVQFRGVARATSGLLTWQDIDQNFLIVKRRDASTAAGVRGVSFTLTTPETSMSLPDLPEAVPIPPPPGDPPEPPYPGDPYDPGGGGDPGGGDPTDPTTGVDIPPFEDPGLPTGGLPPDLLNPLAPQAYQPCCAPPTSINDNTVTPPGSGGGDYHPSFFGGVPPAYRTDGSWFDPDHVMDSLGYDDTDYATRGRTVFFLQMYGGTPTDAGWVAAPSAGASDLYYQIVEAGNQLPPSGANLNVISDSPDYCPFSATIYKAVVGTNTAPLIAGWGLYPVPDFTAPSFVTTTTFAINVAETWQYLYPNPLNGNEHIDGQVTVDLT